jgi:hypothetical protein
VSLHHFLLRFLSAVIQFLVLTILVVLLSATFAVFVIIKELRESTFGKIIMTLLVIFAISIVAYSIDAYKWYPLYYDLAPFAQPISFVFWSQALIIDAYWKIW